MHWDEKGKVVAFCIVLVDIYIHWNMGSENQKPIIMYFDDAKVGLQNLWNLCSTQLHFIQIAHPWMKCIPKFLKLI
jgi:hypothetical protein